MPGPDDLLNLQELMRMSNQGLAEAAQRTGVQMSELSDRLNVLTAELNDLRAGIENVRPRGAPIRAFLDTEASLDPELARSLGVDLPGGKALKYEAETRVHLKKPEPREKLSRIELLLKDEESP